MDKNANLFDSNNDDKMNNILKGRILEMKEKIDHLRCSSCLLILYIGVHKNAVIKLWPKKSEQQRYSIFSLIRFFHTNQTDFWLKNNFPNQVKREMFSNGGDTEKKTHKKI